MPFCAHANCCCRCCYANRPPTRQMSSNRYTNWTMYTLLASTNNVVSPHTSEKWCVVWEQSSRASNSLRSASAHFESSACHQLSSSARRKFFEQNKNRLIKAIAAGCAALKNGWRKAEKGSGGTEKTNLVAAYFIADFWILWARNFCSHGQKLSLVIRNCLSVIYKIVILENLIGTDDLWRWSHLSLHKGQFSIRVKNITQYLRLDNLNNVNVVLVVAVVVVVFFVVFVSVGITNERSKLI